MRCLPLFLAVLMVFAASGCREDLQAPAQESAEESQVTHEATHFQAPPEEHPILSDDEVIDLVFAAEMTALSLFSEAFHLEMMYEDKAPFEEISRQLRLYYSEQVVEYLEVFYEEALWQWGYEMPVAFPFSSYIRAKNGFVEITEMTADMIIAHFINRQEYDTVTLELYTFYIVREGASWVIDDASIQLLEEEL